MAQAEAESGSSQWVNYFVHAGHLHIKGFKMSKSLKNFITIRQALEFNTSRQIRICFLLHKYNDPMDYGDETMAHAVSTESIYNKFFQNIKVLLRASDKNDSAKWGEDEATLGREIDSAKANVHAALCDDFDTPTVMATLQNLVSCANKYIEKKANDKQTCVALVIRTAATYITNMFKVLGLVGDGIELGFPVGDESGGGASLEETVSPYLDAILDFRAMVREAARTKEFDQVLKLCDAFRDDVLPNVGVQLEDKEGSKGVWKLANIEDLKREKEQKEAEKNRKAMEKAKAKEEAAAKEALNRVAPEEFMKMLTLDDKKTMKYSKFDEAGVPTHDAEGEELKPSGVKKAKKEMEGQKKKYEKATKN